MFVPSSLPPIVFLPLLTLSSDWNRSNSSPQVRDLQCKSRPLVSVFFRPLSLDTSLTLSPFLPVLFLAGSDSKNSPQASPSEQVNQILLAFQPQQPASTSSSFLPTRTPRLFERNCFRRSPRRVDSISVRLWCYRESYHLAKCQRRRELDADLRRLFASARRRSRVSPISFPSLAFMTSMFLFAFSRFR